MIAHIEMTESGKCECSVAPNWVDSSCESSLIYEKGSFLFKNAKYTRLETITETAVEFKLSFKTCNKLTNLRLVSNARFVEISVMKDSLLKYVTTVRGTTPESDIYISEFPLFEGQFSDDTCEFRELHLKFLSIKPASGKDTLMQLVILNLSCDYTEGKADTAPPLQSGGSSGGVEMMAMMAMSMMGGGLGGMGGSMGSMGGGPRGMGSGLSNMGGGGTSSGGMPGMAKGVSVPNQGGDVRTRDDSSTTVDTNTTAATQVQTSSDTNLAASTTTPTNTSNTTTAHTTPTPSAAPTSTHNTTHTTPTTAPTTNTTPTTSKPTPTVRTAPPLDGAQLASIMWTVKSSMIDEISQLLDRKLAPIMSRLDTIDVKLRTLEVQVREKSHTNVGTDTVCNETAEL